MALTNVLDNVLPDWARTGLGNLGVQWNNAKGNKTLQDSIHAAAEAIRAQFGYSGGVDGSKVIVLGGGALGPVDVARPDLGGYSGPVVVNKPDPAKVSDAVDVLDPTSFTGVPKLPDSIALTLPSLNIPAGTKSIMLYAGLGIAGLMVLKMFTGGKRA